jgi:hypothetical protein
MALFVDSTPSEPSDLSQYESSIFQTAATEGIDLVTKGTVAATELTLEIQRFLLRIAAGSNIGIDQVVVSDALRRWHILRTITLTYRDAYHQQLNERYKHKLEAYQLLCDSASDLFFQLGVPITYSPLRRPAWPLLGQVAGIHPAGTWLVKSTWINSQGIESEASPLISIMTENGSQLTVAPSRPWASAVGWNVYVGRSEEALAKQNATPLLLSEQWAMPNDGLRPGAAPPNGQTPDAFLRRTTTFLRG